MLKLKNLSCFVLTSLFLVTSYASELPSVKVLAVGGTIAGRAASSTQTSYKAGEIGVQTLLDSVPKLKEIANLSGEQVFNIGSGNLSDENLLTLAKRVNQVAKDSKVDAIVITHGTDTLEETAYFLNLTAKTDKPIVLVGSMRPATAISADGPANLLNAVKTAVAKEAKGQGVLLVMNDEIHNARDVTKMDPTKPSAFASPSFGAVGQVSGGEPHFYKSTLKKHTVQSDLDIENITKLPRVDIIYNHLGGDDALVKAALAAGAKGLVNAGTGNGTVSKFLFKTYADAVKAGVPVVRASRIDAGVVTVSKPDWDKAGFIRGGSLNPQKSRLLLQLALTKTNDPKKIQELFDQY